ncbi:unnamed protein product [Cylindrotheca closterium]|uniref:DUF6824 domain-containing protein n=1 Tax=Cylindrotheca closterium TaxID=2856 RepID=A0AAD2FQ61_9STRA|nr:unnamed protein product [Cylindrotheca closterium]
MTVESWNLWESIETLAPILDEWTAAAKDVANWETGNWDQTCGGNPQDTSDHSIATTSVAPTADDDIGGMLCYADVANQETGSWAQNCYGGNPQDSSDHSIAKASTVPKNDDIVFGRGSGNHYHPGNVMLRTAVEMRLDHHSTLTKTGKSKLICELIETLRSRGVRFLRRDKKDQKLWVEVEEDEIKKKVSHCFRTVKSKINGSREARKKLAKKPSKGNRQACNGNTQAVAWNGNTQAVAWNGNTQAVAV